MRDLQELCQALISLSRGVGLFAPVRVLSGNCRHGPTEFRLCRPDTCISRSQQSRTADSIQRNSCVCTCRYNEHPSAAGRSAKRCGNTTVPAFGDKLARTVFAGSRPVPRIDIPERCGAPGRSPNTALARCQFVSPVDPFANIGHRQVTRFQLRGDVQRFGDFAQARKVSGRVTPNGDSWPLGNNIQIFSGLGATFRVGFGSAS